MNRQELMPLPDQSYHEMMRERMATNGKALPYYHPDEAYEMANFAYAEKYPERMMGMNQYPSDLADVYAFERGLPSPWVRTKNTAMSVAAAPFEVGANMRGRSVLNDPHQDTWFDYPSQMEQLSKLKARASGDEINPWLKGR